MKKDKLEYDVTGRTIRYSFRQGLFAHASAGCVQDFLTPFILLLGGTARQVGLLNALPNLAAALLQIKSADITDWLKSRKKTVIISVFIQTLVLLAVVIVSLQRGITPVKFILLIVLYTCCAALINPAWGSWMSDLVAVTKRGDFFGRRNRILGSVTVGAAFLAGYLLQQMRGINVFLGFTVVFGCAFLFRTASWFYIFKMREPALEYKKESYFSLIQFIKKLKQSNFARFVVFVSLLNFAVNLAAPFFALFMLRELKFSYLIYTVITISSVITLTLTMSRWGRIADRIGNLKVVKLTAVLIGFIPLLWLINRHPVYLIGAQIFSGFIWAGFNLCSSNFIYDAVTPAKRVRCIAYFNVLNGISLFAGALAGGFLLRWLPPLLGYKVLMLFLISGILRILAGLLLPLRLKEVRPVEHMHNYQLFFTMINIRALLGVERKTLRY